jgi:uncharacterized small protein (DUF1192 family)
MLVAALVILAGVVVVASGRGGEMAPEYPDYPPIDLGPVSAADVALLRPPSAAWGYNMRVTDDALETIAQAVTERDIKISALQQEVADLRAELAQDWTRGSVPPGAAAGDQRALEEERPGEGPGSDQPAWPFDEEGLAEDDPGTEAPWPPWAQPEQGGSPAQPTGREITAPQPIAPQSAGPPENSPHPAPAYDDPPYEDSAYGERPYDETSREQSSHDAPSYGEPSHEESSHDAPGPGGEEHPAWHDPDDRAAWEEPRQTLVWGVAHRQAKASRLQEQYQAEDARDTSAEGLSAEDSSAEDTQAGDAPAQDTHGPHPAGPSSAGHWAEVTAPAHYDDAWRPAQAEQDRE